MTFDKLKIGAKFFYAFTPQAVFVFEKKSLSSAYTLNPKTFEREKLKPFTRGICGFVRTVEVQPFNNEELSKELVLELRRALRCIVYCRKNHHDPQRGTGVPIENFINDLLQRAYEEWGAIDTY